MLPNEIKKQERRGSLGDRNDSAPLTVKAEEGSPVSERGCRRRTRTELEFRCFGTQLSLRVVGSQISRSKVETWTDAEGGCKKENRNLQTYDRFERSLHARVIELVSSEVHVCVRYKSSNLWLHTDETAKKLK
jgi:hypothetical protein